MAALLAVFTVLFVSCTKAPDTPVSRSEPTEQTLILPDASD